MTAKRRLGRSRLYGLGAVVALLAGLAAIYATGAFVSNGDAECRGSVVTARALEPFARGEVAALRPPLRPTSMRKLAFNAPDGSTTDVGAFAGRTILLNLWATWCIPCRAEMPALAALQARKGSADFQVVALNVDVIGTERPRAFLKEVGASNLEFYADRANAIIRDRELAAAGLPRTFLIDGSGCQIGVMSGPAEWASADAEALINAAVATR